MATRRRRKKEPSTAASVLKFWATTFVIAGVCAVGSYHFGKHVVGEALRKDDSSKTRPRFAVQTREEPAEEIEDEPPAKAEITVEPREPTERELAEARRAEAEAKAAEKARATETEDAAETDEREPAAEAGRNTRYVVRAGAYTQPERARAMIERLAQSGYQPYITEVVIGGESFQRVNVASLSTKEAAEQLKSQLEASGYEATVVEDSD